MAILFLVPAVFASESDATRAAGAPYSLGEIMMVDGPFYVSQHPYYVVDYMMLSEVQTSMVYDPGAGGFVADDKTIRKVFATKDLKNLVIWDPLFYAIGDYTKIPLGAKFETQNVRNFAEFVSITEEEKVDLEAFLVSYEKIFEDIAKCSRLTNEMLYPDDSYLYQYSRQKPNVKVEIYESSERGHFSYEGFEELVRAYEAVYSDYLQLGLDLNAFASGIEDYPPGTTIEEPFEVILTREGLLEEIEMAGVNGEMLESEITLRRDILSYPYNSQIEASKERAGFSKEGGTKKVCGPTSILLFGLAVPFFLRRGKKMIGMSMFLIAASVFLVGAYAAPSDTEIPDYEDFIAQKITDTGAVEIEIDTADIDEATARDLIEGFPLILEGESVVVRGPYYYYGEPNYIIDITKDGQPTGYLILINGTTHQMVASQRAAFQMLKAGFLADMIESKPLYQDVDASKLKEEADKTYIPPLQIFLENLSVNAEEGKVLEQLHVQKPDFETARELAQHYIQAFALLRNIERVVPQEEAKDLTHGFSENILYLEAYGRAIKGLSADEYFESRRSQYRGRSLNRLPLMQDLADKGLNPSKAQVVHDLTSDLIYDNTFLWHMDKIENPNLFARLAFKEGTYTPPELNNKSE